MYMDLVLALIEVAINNEVFNIVAFIAIIIVIATFVKD